MKLYSSPASPFARKARIVARMLSLALEEIDIDPRADADSPRVNPLAKIPALVFDAGHVLYDSPVICEYLDHKGGGKFFPKAGLLGGADERWRALRLQALGDGICDAAVARVIESRLPEEKRNSDAMKRHLAAIEVSIDVMERECASFAEELTIGEIAALCALGYLDFRMPNHDWRKGHAALARWYQGILDRPEVDATMPRNLS